MRLTPGIYHFALQIEDLEGDGVGIVRGDLQVRRFPPGTLELSDLVLSSAVVEDRSYPRFQRYGRTIFPLPSRRFLRTQPLVLYYEVYNLQPDERGFDSFRIDYTIRADHLDRGAVRRFFGALAGLVRVQEERNAVTFSFEREDSQAEGGIRPEHLAFDTAALPPGEYTLEVVVTDHRSGDRQARHRAIFMIID
jgi:hypothetical protein